MDLPPPDQSIGNTAETTQKRKRGRPRGSRTKPEKNSLLYQTLQSIHRLGKDISIRPIRVCIRSIWDINDHSGVNIQKRRGFICHDYHGQLLEGRLDQNSLPNSSSYLSEGDIYELSGFSVLRNSRQRTLTQLPYYIHLDQETTILNVTVECPIFPDHYFTPQNYQSLLRLANIPSYIPDVVGQIRMLQKVNPHHPETNIEVTIGLLLNRSTMVRLTLCDKQATEFSILQSKKNRQFRVAVFTSVIPKLFKGKLQLRSSPATKFYFSKSIDCIKHFKGRVRVQQQS